MYTFDQVMHDQKDLGCLCSDRPLVTSEIFPPNSFYGGDFAVKCYCNLRPDYSLKGVLPHGPFLEDDWIWDPERMAKVPVVFNFTDHRDTVYLSQSGKIVIPFSSPILFVRKMVESRQPVKHARRGTLFFPLHSTHHIDVRYKDVNFLIDILDNLDDRFRPITICAYWKDYLNGSYRDFERRGYPLVSAGHIYDPFFLFRLFHLCTSFEFSASNRMGTHVLYSMSSGCKYFHIADIQKESFLSKDGAIYQADHHGKMYDKVCEHILTNDPEKSAAAYSLIDSLLGQSNVRSPDDIGKLLSYANRLDRYGFARNPLDGELYFHRPYAQERAVRKLAKRVFRGGVK